MEHDAEKPEKTEGYGRPERTVGGAAGFAEGLNDFIQRNRKTLVILGAAILVLLTGLIAGLGIRDMLRERALKTVEGFNFRYEKLRPDINTGAMETEVRALMDELGRFAGNRSGYAASRSHAILAEIHAEKGDWAAAEQGWRAAAKAGAKTYLAPVSLFNAAAAAEEQGNTAAAIELYTESLSHRDVFPAAPRAQFSIGRLREKEGSISAAIAAYNELLNQWPDVPVWPDLARSRIISLNIEKQ